MKATLFEEAEFEICHDDLRNTPSIEYEVLISDKCIVVVQASKVIKSSSV